jgi:hypothetical protein
MGKLGQLGALGIAFDLDPNSAASGSVNMAPDFILAARRAVVAPQVEFGLAFVVGQRAARHPPNSAR